MAYHQGTVWTWLLGPYALAHYSVYGDTAHALALLEGLAPHLDEACIGSISEIMDGDAPHSPRGCFAQAWGEKPIAIDRIGLFKQDGADARFRVLQHAALASA